MTIPPVYILAGGQSRRFGSDKARAWAGGHPLIVRVAHAAAALGPSITVVGRAGEYEDLGLRTIGDDPPGVGPIGGLAAALADAGANGAAWLLLLSCDFVTLQPHWLGQLCNEAEAPGQAIAFRGERIEPLCAIYHVSSISAVREAITAGDYALHRLLGRLDARYLPLPEDWPALAHVNTPRELHAALKSAEARQGEGG